MKLLVEKKKLAKAIELANVNENSELLFSCDGYQLIISGKAPDIHVEFTFDVEADEPGEIVVAGKDLHKTLKGFNSENIEISANLDFAFFRTPADAAVQSAIKLDAVASDMPTYSANESTFLFKEVAKNIAAKMATPINGVDKKAVKPELRDLGIIINDKLTFVSFSNVSLIENSFKIQSQNEQRKRISLNAAKIAYKLLKTGKSEVDVSLEKTNEGEYLVFRNEHSIIFVKTEDGYPEYKYLDGITPEKIVEIPDAIGIFTAMPAAAKTDSIIELSIQDNTVLTTLCDTSVTSNFSKPCKAEENFKFKTNGKRLKEAFSGFENKDVTIGIIPKKVFIITKDNEYKFIGSLIH